MILVYGVGNFRFMSIFKTSNVFNITLCFLSDFTQCLTFKSPLDQGFLFHLLQLMSHLIYIYKKWLVNTYTDEKCGAGTETQQMFSALPVLLIEIHFNFCYGRGSVLEKRDLRA